VLPALTKAVITLSNITVQFTLDIEMSRIVICSTRDHYDYSLYKGIYQSGGGGEGQLVEEQLISTILF